MSKVLLFFGENMGEKEFLQLAGEKGYLTQEQVQQALEQSQQQKIFAAQICLQHGWLNQNQINELKKELAKIKKTQASKRKTARIGPRKIPKTQAVAKQETPTATNIASYKQQNNQKHWRKAVEGIFAKLAITQAALKSDEVLDCLALIDSSRQDTGDMQLGRILMQKNLIDSQKLIKLHQSCQNIEMECSGCQKSYTIGELSQTKSFNCPNCGATLEEPETLQEINIKSSNMMEITSFGEYDLIEEIARGGMGIVYKAKRKNEEKIVALKVMRQLDAVDATEAARFQREIDTASKLNHPHIVAIHDSGKIDKSPFFTMEYIEGETLSDYISSGMKIKEAVSLMEKLAHAVHHAHVKKIIHRDLKPANIIMDDQGEPHITDFGLAKDISSTSKLTQSGTTLGTPYYMSPEQSEGKKSKIGPPTDIYALGVILYEAVTGRLPFEANTLGLLYYKICSEEAESPRTHNPNISAKLENIILKAMAKQIDDRYRTAKAFANDLNRFRTGKAVRAKSSASPLDALKNPKVLTAILGLLGFLAIFLFLQLGSTKKNSGKEKKIAKMLKSLQKLEKKGNYKKLKIHAQKLLDKHGASLGHFYLGKYYVNSQQDNKAISSFLDLYYNAYNIQQRLSALKNLLPLVVKKKNFFQAHKILSSIDTKHIAKDQDLSWLAAKILFYLGEFKEALKYLNLSSKDKGEYTNYYSWATALSKVKKFSTNSHYLALLEIDHKPGRELVLWDKKEMTIYDNNLRVLYSISPPSGGNFDRGLAVTDIDKDGKMDLFVAARRPGAKYGEIHIYSLRQNRFVHRQVHTTNADVSDIWAGGLGKNSPNFVIIAVGWPKRNTHVLFYADKKLQIKQIDPRIGKGNTDTMAVDVANLDNKGLSEIVLGLGPWTYYGLYIYNFHPKKGPQLKAYRKMGIITGCKTGDINNDGQIEVIAVKSYTKNTQVFKNTYGHKDGLYVFGYNAGGLFPRWQKTLATGEKHRNYFRSLAVGNVSSLGTIAACRYSQNIWLVRFAANKYNFVEFTLKDQNIYNCAIGDTNGDGQGELLVLAKGELFIYGRD